MAGDLAVPAELVDHFFLDLTIRCPVHATLHASRRFEVHISLGREFDIAKSVAEFLIVGPEWIMGEWGE